jgi:ankyrin repeat protein
MNSEANERLIKAVRAGDEPAVTQALADGASADASMGRFRGSVLGEAARDGRLEIVRQLVEAGAGLGPPSEFRSASALRIAVLEANTDVVRYLLTQGALRSEPTRMPSALNEAVSYTAYRPRPSALETLRVLLESAATTRPDEEKPLITAVMRSAPPAAFRLLLAHGADPDEQRSDGTPAIVVAARRGDHAAVDALVEAGADVDARDLRGRTALMHAVERDEKLVAQVLLTGGADVGAADDDGTTALRLAQGWQNQNIQFRMGEHSVGRDDVPITRTFLRVTPTAVRLAGDPPMFHLLADVIDIALDDLGDDEWETRSGLDAEVARSTAARLRDGLEPAPGASWYRLDLTRAEFATMRSSLVELAYGTTRATPAGTTRLEIIDVLEELE